MPRKTKAGRAAYMADYRARKQKFSDEAVAAQPVASDSTPVSPDGPVTIHPETGPTRRKRSGSVPPQSAENPPISTLPAFLAAPDDDCLSCGHDQQAYHLVGPCTFPVGRRQTCGCPAFLAAF